MEEATATRPRFFKSLIEKFYVPEDDDTDIVEPMPTPTDLAKEKGRQDRHPAKSYKVAVWKNVPNFDVVCEAADGLIRGEQQVINLSDIEPPMRGQWLDFLAGVSYAQNGQWHDLGNHTIMICPAVAHVDSNVQGDDEVKPSRN